MNVVACAHCGAQNRVANYSFSHAAACGKCRMSLPEPIYIRFVRMIGKYKYWIILIGILGGAVLVNEFRSPYRPADVTSVSDAQDHPVTPTTNANSPAVSEDLDRLSTPDSASNFVELPPVAVNQGVHQILTEAELIAPFRIVTPKGQESYYVKLVDAFTGTPVMTFFIFGGRSFETKIPLGTYRVKYATGETWYGQDFLFGPNTSYSEADETFEFSVQENRVSGYTVELIRQRGGNLRTRSIPASQF